MARLLGWADGFAGREHILITLGVVWLAGWLAGLLVDDMENTDGYPRRNVTKQMND